MRAFAGAAVPASRDAGGDAGAGPLGKREADVAWLVAGGLTIKQIGTRLFISGRPVDSHVRSILNKLGFSSRAQIAAWAAGLGQLAGSPDGPASHPDGPAGHPGRIGQQVLEVAVNRNGYQVVPVGWVESSLTDRSQAPRQGDEGAPDAWLVFEPAVAGAISDIAPGTEIIVLTWLDRADRGVLVTRPRDDPASPLTGVFSTRSPDRPNPIGLHRAQVIATDGLRVLVRPLEALDKTPVIDVKPVLDRTAER